MGRTYAGILGPISFGTVIARALLDGMSAESALVTAAVALFVFAAIGYVVGILAERIVVEGIESRFRAQWQQTTSPEAPTGTGQTNQSAASAA
jgi:tetrahydromethanopterin S-methyltransferase subunit C